MSPPSKPSWRCSTTIICNSWPTARTQIARITTKDPTAPPPLSTRVIQLKYASTSNMVDSIQASFTDKRSKVLPDVRTSQLIVVATEPEQEAVDTLINQLDKPTRQVLIETKLVEISSNPTTAKGVDWSGTLAAQHVTFGNGSYELLGKQLSQCPAPPSPSAVPLPAVATPAVAAHAQLPAKQTIFDISQGAGGVSWNTLSGFTPGIGFLNADGASAVLLLPECSLRCPDCFHSPHRHFGQPDGHH